MTGLNCRTWGATQVGSFVVFSEYPAAWPRLLISNAWPLFPLSVGSGVITPSRQRNGWQTRELKNRQKFSPFASGLVVSELPATSPLSLSGKPEKLFGPPSVPRSFITPFRQRKARWVWFPGRNEPPFTQRLPLTPVASLTVP